MKMLMPLLLLSVAAAVLTRAMAQEEKPYQPLRPDQTAYRALYKELVETNTTLSTGSCTQAAATIAAHLKAAGFPAADITHFADPGPSQGRRARRDPARHRHTAKPMLLLGHLDVVEAKRADWTRDPFKLIEEKGYFYGRGTADMKAMIATWVDMLMRFKQGGLRTQAHHQAGADLRRGDHLRLQRRGMAGEEPARPDRRGIRAQRRRRRPHRRPWQAA